MLETIDQTSVGNEYCDRQFVWHDLQKILAWYFIEHKFFYNFRIPLFSGIPIEIPFQIIYSKLTWKVGETWLVVY